MPHTLYSYLNKPSLEIATEFHSLKLYSEHSFIYLLWYEGISDEEYRRAMLSILEQVITFDIKYILSDAAAIGYISPENQQWMQQNIFPGFAKTNLEKFARLVYLHPLSILSNQIISHEAMKLNHNGVNLKFGSFTEIDAALEWLGLDEQIV